MCHFNGKIISFSLGKLDTLGILRMITLSAYLLYIYMFILVLNKYIGVLFPRVRYMREFADKCTKIEIYITHIAQIGKRPSRGH